MTPEEIREFASRGYWIKAELAVEALDSQAAEIKRLEAAYLDEARENIQATKEFLQDRQTPEEYQAEIDRLARASLARVKGAE